MGLYEYDETVDDDSLGETSFCGVDCGRAARI
jgi:hypothetical protein